MPNNRLITILVFVLTTIFYAYTLLPSLAWGDGVKLQTEVITGESFVLSELSADEFSPDPFIFSKVGVAAWDHPLYIMLGHALVKAFPYVDSLWLVNFISAIFGAASIALVYALCHRFTGSVPVSSYAAFSLAVSHTFWWHSSTPEVYTLFAFLFLASFYFFHEFEQTKRYPFLLLSGLFLGLAASDHILAVLAVPSLVLYYLFLNGLRLPRRLDRRALLYSIIGFTLGFLPYLIQFVRMTRSFPPSEIMGPVVGLTFLNALSVLSPIPMGKSLITFLVLMTVQFSPIGVVFGSFGIRRIFHSEDISLRKIIACLIAFTTFGILYQVSDQFAFFLTSYVFWALTMGFGVQHFLSTLSRNRWMVAYSVLTLLIVLTPLFYASLPGLLSRAGLADASAGIPQIGIGLRDGLTYYVNPNKRGDLNAHDFGTQTLARLAPDAVVLAEWYADTDEYFVLRYFQKVQKLRPDVTLVGWPTADPFTFDSQLAVDVIEESVQQRPVYLASLSDPFYDASKLMERYCVVPESNLYRLYPEEFRENGLFKCIGAASTDQ